MTRSGLNIFESGFLPEISGTKKVTNVSKRSSSENGTKGKSLKELKNLTPAQTPLPSIDGSANSSSHSKWTQPQVGASELTSQPALMIERLTPLSGEEGQNSSFGIFPTCQSFSFCYFLGKLI